MPAYLTENLDDDLVVTIRCEKFKAAFRAFAYAWEGQKAPDLLPEIIREHRGWRTLDEKPLAKKRNRAPKRGKHG